MEFKLHFLGAAQNVTGSCYMIEANDQRVLVDCGMYQERKFTDRNWAPFPVAPGTIDAVVITHAHLDHSGLLPKFVREGYKGNIYGTAATMEIAEIICLDSAHIQEEDAKFKQRRHDSEERESPHSYVPLYSTDDAKAAVQLFRSVDYKKSVEVAKGITVTWHDAGHILGSSMLQVKVKTGDEERILLFSGDVGRKNKPIICDPTFFEKADYVITESTYGNRIHTKVEDINDELADVINDTFERRGNIVIPSFAVERTHELLYALNELLLADRIPHLMVFVDSPMAVNVTDVFKKHPEYFDEEMSKMLAEGHSPFDFPSLKLSRSVADSKAINHIHGTCIIIAGSGMCTGGRIKHHLIQNISRSESTILFVGYQAEGTLGRMITSGMDHVRIQGQSHAVNAAIEQIHGFSGHADKRELFEWLTSLKTPPKKVFVTHGEVKAATEYVEYIKQQVGWEVEMPAYMDVVTLD
jgi:metallo-beta-lactamase family protein